MNACKENFVSPLQIPVMKADVVRCDGAGKIKYRTVPVYPCSNVTILVVLLIDETNVCQFLSTKCN